MATAQSGLGEWSAGSGPSTPAYPDGNARYWTLPFRNVAGLSLRLRAEFPYARFTSLTVYDLDTTDVSSVIRDDEITADAGSENPFSPGTSRDATPRKYTLWLLPEGSANATRPNAISIDSSIRCGVLMLRVYLPDDGRDSRGGVALPTVEAFDDATGQAIPASSFGLSSREFVRKSLAAVGRIEGRIRDDIAATIDERISFFRVRFAAGFPNRDNGYLSVGLSTRAQDRVAVLRLRAPSFPQTLAGGGAFSGTEDVRYWSINFQSDVATTTLGVVHDEKIPLDSAGFATVVIGPASVRAATEAAGFAFLERDSQRRPRSLLLRNLVSNPAFSPKITDLPFFDRSQPLDEQRAERVLGDFAPTGRYYSESAYLRAVQDGAI